MARSQYNPGSSNGIIGQRPGYGGYSQPGIRRSGPRIRRRFARLQRNDVCSTSRSDTVFLTAGGTAGQVYRIYCREIGKSKLVTFPGSVDFRHTANLPYHYDCPELVQFSLTFAITTYPSRPTNRA